MIALDIFSGAGGMGLGASMSGINIHLAIENNLAAANTFKQNHPNTTVFCSDIKDFDTNTIDEDIFIIFGGPPCQGFSISNTKTRDINNPNNNLFNEFIRIIKEVEPLWFVFENVEGFVSFNGGEVLTTLRDIFAELGYITNDTVLCAANYGVPQKRKRFFMVGNRIDINFEFPERRDIEITVGDAIRDLPSLENGMQKDDNLPYKKVKLSEYAKLMRQNSKQSTQNFVSKNKDYVLERYKHIGIGENWKSIPKELMSNYKNTDNCHSGIYRRLHPDKPSVVIANYRKNMLIHPFENRGLSVREAARIQSFPDNFIFKGTISEQQQQIGNAVPPLLAKAIFDKIIELTPNEYRQLY